MSYIYNGDGMEIMETNTMDYACGKYDPATEYLVMVKLALEKRVLDSPQPFSPAEVKRVISAICSSHACELVGLYWFFSEPAFLPGNKSKELYALAIIRGTSIPSTATIEGREVEVIRARDIQIREAIDHMKLSNVVVPIEAGFISPHEITPFEQ